MKYNILTFLVVSVCIVACQTPSPGASQAEEVDQEEGTPVGVHLLFKIGETDDDLLYQASGIAAGPASTGGFYVLDRGGYTLKSYDETGRLIKSVGAHGAGPGEFMNPVALGVTNKYPAVSEQNAPRVHLFDLNLTYAKDLLLEVLPADLNFTQDSLLLMSGIPMQPTALSQFGTMAVDQYQFSPIMVESPRLPDKVENDPDVTPMRRALWRVAYLAGRDDFVWMAYAYYNRIVCLKGGQVAGVYQVDALPEETSIHESSVAGPLPAEVLFRDVAVDDQRNAYVLVGEVGDHPKRTVYVLDETGAVRRTLVLASAARAIAWAAPNRLYAVEKGGTQVSAYEILPGETASSK